MLLQYYIKTFWYYEHECFPYCIVSAVIYRVSTSLRFK